MVVLGSWFLCVTYCVFFFNDTATTEIYTLSLHDALPISILLASPGVKSHSCTIIGALPFAARSEEHTSELQSPDHLVCRLLLEKNKHASYIMLKDMISFAALKLQTFLILH